MTTKTPREVVAQIIFENYGPEGDPDLYRETQIQCQAEKPTAAQLIDTATLDRDLMGDGICQLMRAAIEADRAQRPTLNWEGASEAVQAYWDAAEGDSNDSEIAAAQDVVAWVESALAGDVR